MLYFVDSVRTLQRIMKEHGLQRYDSEVIPQQVAQAIQVYMRIIFITLRVIGSES
jgi:predicted RNA methylase